MDNKFTYAFLNFLHSCGNKGVWMQPLNHGMTRQVFYHCVNTAGKEVNLCFLYFLHPSVNAGVWTQILNLGMTRQVFTVVLPLLANKLTHFYSYFLHSCGISGVLTQTLNLGMMREVFYHCTNTAGKDEPVLPLFSPSQCQRWCMDSSSQPWDDESVLPLYCH
jgi:hypothetical protein